MATDMTVSTTILEQLGGRRFLVMTGANNCIGSDNSLSFRIPAARNKINCVRIELGSDDLYTMSFLRIWGTKVACIETISGVYCDMLRDIFEDKTGLLTSL